MSEQSNVLKQFNYTLFSLKDGRHEFSHQIGDLFFDSFENSLVPNGNFKVDVVLEKSERLLQFEFFIEGSSLLVCDRSLEEFEYPIKMQTLINYKYGEAYEEMAEDLIVLKHGTSELNIASVLYELIAVEIPFKKLHPKFEQEETEEQEQEVTLVYSGDTQDESQDEEQKIDPRWSDLRKKFKNGI